MAKPARHIQRMSREEIQATYTHLLNSKISRCGISKRPCHLWYDEGYTGWCVHTEASKREWRCPEWKGERE